MFSIKSRVLPSNRLVLLARPRRGGHCRVCGLSFLGEGSTTDNQAQAVFIPLLKTIEKDRTTLAQDGEFSRVEFGLSLLKVVRGRAFSFHREHSLLLNHEASGECVYGTEQHYRLSNRKASVHQAPSNALGGLHVDGIREARSSDHTGAVSILEQRSA